MARKRHLVRRPRPPPAASAATEADPAPAGVNERLASLRRASVASAAGPPPAAPAPSLPPAVREMLQLPETPAPLPRRPARQRFDSRGRGLPPGPAPPRSWVSAEPAEHRSPRPSPCGRASAPLPGAYAPAPGSLVDVALRRLARDWELQRVYNQHHLFFLPSHLKPALMRHVGAAARQGVTVADLRALLLPPTGAYADDELAGDASSNADVTCLDLSGSVGRSLGLRELSRLLFPPTGAASSEPLRDDRDAADALPSPPRALLPRFTHLSLAVEPAGAADVSWRQLLALSAKLGAGLTHLSLAFWPEPSLGRRALGHGDWGDALVSLRLLSRALYGLEFLDLTGCAPWFDALRLADGPDCVDWAGPWGGVSRLRLRAGWMPGPDALPAHRAALREAAEAARRVERHIVAQRAGRGVFITVERDVDAA